LDKTASSLTFSFGSSTIRQLADFYFSDGRSEHSLQVGSAACMKFTIENDRANKKAQ